jgi:hypothetical protein
MTLLANILQEDELLDASFHFLFLGPAECSATCFVHQQPAEPSLQEYLLPAA